MNNEQLNKWIDETLNSLDGMQRANPKPYLFTRLTAKMQHKESRSWDNALRFLSRPAVAIASVLLVVAVNTMVFTMHQKTGNTPATITNDDPQYAAIDGYNGSVSILRDIENIEP
mgnify:CR=1 FL=1